MRETGATRAIDMASMRLAQHTRIRLWPNLVVTPDTPWWGRAWGYAEVAWFIVFSLVAYLPMAARAHWRHQCEASDCAFIEIGVNKKRWLRW